MPRVHFVKKARKARREHGIKKGDSYWWWANRMPGRMSGVKRYSKTPPERWQTLPPGSFAASVAFLQQQLDNLSVEMGAEDLKSAIDGVAEEVRSLAEEQDEKFNNMPESLRAGPTGELLNERQEALASWADELEAVEEDEDDPQNMIDEAQAAEPGV